MLKREEIVEKKQYNFGKRQVSIKQDCIKTEKD